MLPGFLNLDDDQSSLIFFKFVKDRAKLVNNEFGEDLVLSSSMEKKRVNERWGRSIPKLNAFTTKAEPGRIGNQDGSKK